MRLQRGFTLIELLVTISVIGVLISLMLPALGTARKTAVSVQCLSNMRSMELAHWAYMNDNDDRLVNVGLGGGGHDPANSWINTLNRYNGGHLLRRSPVDDSVFWDIPGNGGELRQTSYGINNYLVPSNGFVNPVVRLMQVSSPSATVHFLYMSESDPTYAVTDHPHIEQWPAFAPLFPATGIAGAASQQLETNVHGGLAQSWGAVSNYGFLDGHAKTMSFSEVYATDSSWNKFDPAAAR